MNEKEVRSGLAKRAEAREDVPSTYHFFQLFLRLSESHGSHNLLSASHI